ncbi:hypothetical protein CHCC20441_0604 [Bacillus licheniformis]|nr:hypothetical protein B4090_3345 [Bacillus licheniformis]TWN15576.1 hypothetical protein CHCC14564_0141 [Bacillus licheniformis LMG 17339]KYC78945.1 hypothetical protein B4092_3244 [Bacillus licheniformis]OLF86174.1 hypothetical protein B4094_4638 [Bacillus licheniformis]OLF89111.1 hypothetical protein B4089_3206 [Bacillus licheniformis]
MQVKLYILPAINQPKEKEKADDRLTNQPLAAYLLHFLKS